ncbi:hypothetical protein KKB64_04695 [Patescibacteria group bacterium]|nr:hypothetical protein [Patescibacteria group bacterium]MBU1473049.1 hypothetical protein [Patescibacteria group bacterium]MBU2460195.1 hypothetical protein [Patescibacteria group bacterium]MBU2543918.1 hypothetical protein [Patescibacteria group bacterium]
MKHSLKTGLSFGLTSATITTLGLMVGLYSGTHSKAAVLGGIFTIAVADAFSDALGIHISEESENIHSPREIWESTFSTFFSKFFFALTFAVPLLTLSLPTAITVSVVWGLTLLTVFSVYLAKLQKINPKGVVLEHLIIGIAVIVVSRFIGMGVAKTFG